MKQYVITKPNRGYIMRDMPSERGYASVEEYAFTTLKELQEFLPGVFEPKEMPIKTKSKQPGVEK